MMQISPFLTFGKSGGAPTTDRFVKSDGIKTLVRKFRLCQSELGRSPTFVEGFAAPFSDALMTLRRLFFEKGIGTVAQPYKLHRVKQHGAMMNLVISS